MSAKTLKIHTENILPIIKQWLYSDKEIFIREVISNACDALHKCKVLREHQEAIREAQSESKALAEVMLHT